MTRKILVTSALPYINGVKHLGNLIGSMLPADVFARFMRQQGEDVLFICGTDEHGTPAELAAQEAGLPVESYCQKLYELQKSIYEGFQLSFDFFGRTSSPSNHQLTTSIFEDLFSHGFIKEQAINQYFSATDGRFLPDRYVEGSCPHCGYEKARGDQCDGCGVLLNPEELLNPYSAISKSRDLVLKKTVHFFLDLPKLEPEITAWVNQQDQWSDVVRGIARKWLQEGLRPRCITRDLKWGIKVPLEWVRAHEAPSVPVSPTESDGDEGDKVFYVWFDAPNGYISITMDWAKQQGTPEAWKEWWMPRNPEEVTYVEFMAKDNVPFHSIFWPAILMGTRKPYKKVDDIKGFHWLTYDKGKFSTSQKRGVFTDTALELYPADYWRYYLLANCPETSDADFTFESFAALVNKDLADILGNFANRTLALLSKYFNLSLPMDFKERAHDAHLEGRCRDLVNDITTHLTQRRFRAATAALRALWVVGNEYITEKEPWHVLKEDPQAGGEILVHCVHLLRIFAVASFPFIPHTAQKLADMLCDPTDLAKMSPSQAVDFKAFAKGHTLREMDRLFEKIPAEKVAEWTQEYSGNRS